MNMYPTKTVTHKYFNGRQYVTVLSDGQETAGRTQDQADKTAYRLAYGEFHPLMAKDPQGHLLPRQDAHSTPHASSRTFFQDQLQEWLDANERLPMLLRNQWE